MTACGMTLTEFLLARIAEDEAAANAASRGMAHIARHDPARVLADCVARTEIVKLHPLDPIVEHSWGTTGGGCNLCDHDCNSGGDTTGDGPCDTLRALALSYADHDDYREEWKP